MKKIKYVLLVVFVVALLLVMGGCAQTSGDFYALPKMPNEYIALQAEIDRVLAAGAEYSAPTSGSNRQAVQMHDLDGDGEDEIMAFFNFRGVENPLKLYVYRYQNEKYSIVTVIEGEGSSFGSVDYADMDGDGMLEIFVDRRLVQGVNMLSVYSLHNGQLSVLLGKNYTEYTVSDVIGSEYEDLIIVRNSEPNQPPVVEVYSFGGDGEVDSFSCRLTANVTAVTRLRTGRLEDGVTGVFVEGTLTSGMSFTDIIVWNGRMLENITTEWKHDLQRNYAVFSRDINGDGVMDVPVPESAPAQLDSMNTYWIVKWYAYSSDGGRIQTESTYLNYSDGWCLFLPEKWEDKITVRREDSPSGERAVIISYYRNGRITDFLAVYTLTGENKEERAQFNGRFVLLNDGATVYAAKILVEPDGFNLPVSEELIKENFTIIYTEWITGAT